MEKNSPEKWRRNNKVPGAEDVGFSLLLNQLGFDDGQRISVKTCYDKGIRLHVLHQRSPTYSAEYEERMLAKQHTNMAYLKRIYPDLFNAYIPFTILLIADPVMAYGVASVLSAAREQLIALYWPDTFPTEPAQYHEGNVLASANRAAQAITGYDTVPYRRHLGPSVTQFYKAPPGCPDLSIEDRSLIYSWLTRKHDWLIIVGETLPEVHIPFGINVKTVKVTKHEGGEDALHLSHPNPTVEQPPTPNDTPITLQSQRERQRATHQFAWCEPNRDGSWPLTLDGRPIKTCWLPAQAQGDKKQLLSWMCTANMICEYLLAPSTYESGETLP